MAAPTPGTTAPGDLYVDLQSRQLWLGVDTAEDPAGSVLISDMLALQTQIAQSLISANTYTNSQIQTRAPTIHTHTADQITDFTAAVLAAVSGSPSGGSAPSGLIAMYGGSLANIGVGDWAGWVLCDGQNDTPDLRDQFIMGAGNRPPGPHTQVAAITADAGSHSHTVTGTVLTLNQMPRHNHSMSFVASGGTDAQGNHSHTIGNLWAGGINTTGTGGGTSPTQGTVDNTNPGAQSGVAGNHAHNVSVNVIGSTALVGSDEAHTHTTVPNGTHNHTIPLLALREALPYYLLAFVKKL